MIPAIDDQIIDTLNLEGFTPDERNEIITKVEENIRTALLLEILDRLEEAERTMLTEMSMEKAGDKAKEFLNTRIPDFNGIVTSTSMKVVQEFNDLRK